MKSVVSVDSVSKKYSRNADTHRNYGLSDLMREVLGCKAAPHLRQDEFYALRNVSLQLNQGDSIGLMGRNGSGKSTLLKVMTGLVKPDAGQVVMRGRVQALINLGAGFDMALSGLENLYNSAALMGMNASQSRLVVDEVIDFSELSEFIKSPVYTYSSGMKARLGFSVAISLKPDTLLIDEVLAVGDFAFANKCKLKMQELKKQGVTIVLVTHAHNSILQLCDRAIWLHQGSVMRIGESKEVVSEYLGFLELEEEERIRKEDARKSSSDSARPEQPNPERQRGNGDRYDGMFGPIFSAFDHIRDLEFRLLVSGKDTERVELHTPITLEYAFTLNRYVEDLNVTLKFFKKDGLNLTTISTLNGDLVRHIHKGRLLCRCHLPDFIFTPGCYALVLAIHEGVSYLYRDVVRFFAVTGNGHLNWGICDLQNTYEVVVYDDVEHNDNTG